MMLSFRTKFSIPLLVAAALLLAACSEEGPTDFTADNRAGFLAACSEPLEDAVLIGQICQCVFERTQDEFAFEEFEAMDEALQADPTQSLQAEVNVIIADCVRTEAEL